MSEEILRQIINRAILDEKFRQALYTNPEGTLAEYQLTPEEKGYLANLPVDTLTEMTGNLEERISRARGPFGLYPTAVCQAYTDAC